MSARPRRRLSTARFLLLALFLSAGAAGAARVEDPLAPVREGMRTLGPAIQSATMLPLVGGILRSLLEASPLETGSLDRLFEDAFVAAPTSADAAGDPILDEFSEDDMELLEF